jgi:formylglycine-generating enzyme required for sulfatase activity
VLTYCDGDEQPEHEATVAEFVLDKYEVTVGRFRAFVDAGGGTQSRPPVAGSGASPLVSGSGWDSAWNAALPADRTALVEAVKCVSGYETWTDTAGNNETYPMNCVSWYEAFAFCIWDGGRLPTGVEWEYAAAGAGDNRVYPWGDQVTEPLPANYYATDNSPFVAVGSYPDGDGRWGHAELAGSLWEWTLDWYAYDWHVTAPSDCSDCANLTPATERVIRGGNWYSSAGTLRSTYRFGRPPDYHRIGIGFRCAGSAP